MSDFSILAKRALQERGFSMRCVAKEIFFDVSYISRVLNGKQQPSRNFARELDKLLGTNGMLEDAAVACHETPTNDELEAWEFLRRVAASDVCARTLERMESGFDDLATRYSSIPPMELLVQVRQHSGYVLRLLEGRKSLDEHHRLLCCAGWLWLLGATLQIDLGRNSTAIEWLKTASSLGKETSHNEIQAWCYETHAWLNLVSGDHPAALKSSRTARDRAPARSSALIQATAQEGRIRARIGHSKEVYKIVDRVQTMASGMRTPDNVFHHYRYDPTKANGYSASALAWLGDSAAEGYAREVIARLGHGDDPAQWPRRMAGANLDLALTLINGGRVDEACERTHRAISSGKVAFSSHWRVLEVVKAAEARSLPEAAGLREAYQSLRPASRTCR